MPSVLHPYWESGHNHYTLAVLELGKDDHLLHVVLSLMDFW